MTYPDERIVHYEFDDMGKVVGVTVTRNGEDRVIASSIEYFHFAPMKGLDFGNGINLAKSFDQAYRITSRKQDCITIASGTMIWRQGGI